MATDPPLFAGLDVSTQSCKLVVIDPELGTVAHVDQVTYDRDLPHYETVNGTAAGLGPGASESDPRMWIEAVDMILERLATTDLHRGRIRCISVSGQQHGLVALAANGSLARPRSKLWNDFSTEEECGILTDAVGGPEAMIAEVGNTQRTGYTAPKILHLRRHEPEAFRQTQVFLLVHNYVNWHLTGGPGGGGVAVMEPGDTSGTALWHPGTGQWSSRVLDAIDPGLADRLPPVRPADRTIGSLAPALAHRFGLSPDCRIDAGSGDNMYGAVGTGNIRPGLVTVSLGTSGTAYTILDRPFIDPTGEVAAFCDSTGRHLPLLCVSNLANGYDALREEFHLTFRDCDDHFFRSEAGSGGRVILPWFGGERTPDLPRAASVFFGFGPSDFRPEILCRAMVEGHVLNLHDGFARLPVVPREIRVTGGLSRSPAWCQAIADIFGAEVVPVGGEGAALGAAIHAGWVWLREEGADARLEEVSAPFVALTEDARRRPHPDHRETHERLVRLFRALSRRARGMDGEDAFAIRQEILAAGAA
jgi:xylulokinase